MEINAFTSEEIGIFLKEAKKLNKQKNKLNKKLDSTESDEVFYELSEKEQKLTNYISLFKTVERLDELFPNRVANKLQYDVTKILIHPDTEAIYKEYDFLILKMIYPHLSKKAISKELSMLYFIQGFAVSSEISENKIVIKDGVLKKTKI